MRVALVGTGAMGYGSAERLLAENVPLRIFNRTRAVAAPLERQGARIAEDVESAVQASDVVLFFLRGHAATRTLLAPLVEGGLRGKTIVQMGLTGRRQARSLERMVRRAGGSYLNVSLCGTKNEARHGRLVLLVGGRRRAARRAGALLARLGTAIDVGGVRASATAGLGAMLMSFGSITSFCHAVASMRRAGLGADGLLDALTRCAPFTRAASFLREYEASRAQPAPGDLRAAVRRGLARARAEARESGVADTVYRAVRDEVRAAFADDVARFVRLAWPADRDPVRDAAGTDDPLACALFQLVLSAFAAYALACRMLAAEGLPASVLARVVEQSPLFDAGHRMLAAAYAGRLALRNYAAPTSTVRVIHEELRQVRSTLASLGLESPLPRAMARLTRACIDRGLADADFFAVNLVVDPPAYSEEKRQAIEDNLHVNPGRVGFFLGAGIDFVMGRREGPYLHDIDGAIKLFDLHCNGGVFNLGHRHPRIAAALQGAIQTFDIGNHHLLSAQRGTLARRLAALLPGDISRVVFGVSGGESVDLAIKIARASTGRSKIVFARGGYHGHTGLAVFAGDARFHEDFAPRPPSYRDVEMWSLPSLRQALDSDTAAVLCETVPASFGMRIPPADFFAQARRLCDEAGALLLVDEVQSGWGRSGKLWAIDHFGVVPDVMILGKGMSAGLYPMSAVAFRPHLGEYLTRDSFRHQSTMGGAEVGCAVVLEQLDIVTAPGFLDHVEALARAFAESLAELRKRHPDVLVEVRQLGLLMGLVYPHPAYGPLMTRCAYDEGLLLVFAGLEPCVSQLLPPLTTRLEEVPLVVARLDAALARARRLVAMMPG